MKRPPNMNSEGPNTRSKSQIREVVDIMLGVKKQIKKVHDKRYKEKLRTIFYALDQNRDNKIDKFEFLKQIHIFRGEFEAVFRRLGKVVTKGKLDKLISSMSQGKNDYVEIGMKKHCI
jgi:Ca2+-binding EF-hand superfamily protein